MNRGRVVAGVLVLAWSVFLVVATLAGWWSGWIAAVASLPILVGTAWLVGTDSQRRGRSGVVWLLFCIFLAPLGIPVFLIVAVLDRVAGRRGIEANWPPSGRWYLLAAVVLVVAAGAFAVSPFWVGGESVTYPGGSAQFSGYCGAPLSVAAGDGPFRSIGDYSNDPPAALAAEETAANRCSPTASKRMDASAFLLTGAVILALIGAGTGIRDRRLEVLASSRQ